MSIPVEFSSTINRPKTMTSIQITRAISDRSGSEKTHSNVLKKIRSILNKLDLEEDDYTPSWTSRGSIDFLLELPLPLASIVISQYDIKFGYEIVSRVTEPTPQVIHSQALPPPTPEESLEDIAGSLIHDHRGSLKLLLSEILLEASQPAVPTLRRESITSYLTAAELGKIVGKTSSDINYALANEMFHTKISGGYRATEKAKGLCEDAAFRNNPAPPKKFGWSIEVLRHLTSRSYR